MIVLDQEQKKDRLSTLVSNHMNQIVASYTRNLENELTAPQYFIIMTLANEGRKNSSELAALLSISLSSVTNLTNKLVNKGYIQRMESEEDRRQIYLHLTNAGRELETKIQEKYREINDRLWTNFSDQELDQLIASYEKMLINFNSKG
ncbi:MarR family winged helix-turn-helix transcriptional regulator [Paenibacillus radicibacter]|uniref:MarR family winged helix-turn-helix transcriptional regulator n=1 Tax=Paenibacillus radicibacter TaxID=2972488 RepID=UPI002158F0F1|nr:MarR family transcriptional regulator [Paenibacillus radicibacter]